MKGLYILLVASFLIILCPVPALATTEISVVAIPNPIGIPEVLIAIALLALACWKKDWIRIILSLCLVIWGTFFMPYDIKVAAPFLGVGIVLFIMGILNQVKHVREAT